jgi:hypothetical protein
MNDHRFIATHVIHTATRRHYVHVDDAERSADGLPMLVLYTEAEWNASEPACWTFDVDRGVCQHGEPFPGAIVQAFGECRWTRLDGWADDGTRDPAAEG